MGSPAVFQDDLKLLQRDFMPLDVTTGFCSELICFVTLAQKKLKVLASKAALVCTCSLKFASFLSCRHCCATKNYFLLPRKTSFGTGTTSIG